MHLTKKQWFPDKNGFSPGQLKIADFIERHPDEALFMTEQEIADRIGTSIATVSRFWRAAGYENGKDFKQKLRSASDTTPALKLETTISKLDPSSLPMKMLEQSLAHLQETAEKTDPAELKRAASLMAGARRIYVHAPGPAMALGELLHYRLSRFGMSVRLMAPSGHELLESLARVQREDVVVMFNFARLLPETEVLQDCVRRIGCSAVLITDREEFRYGAQADAAFYVSRGEMGEFHSMVTPLLLIEQLILSIGLLNKESVLSKLEYLGELRARYAEKLPRGKA
ncbi:MurR/RpiR family transcriptional regulator [Cohnella massiliensis]|uniref:MurR/RpiR family transcriptional regulator n=1 Tax=Cohnella massiliensis TaxID=1816691 RepID=UPI0009BB56A3|nr:MurR/RpiR family transcriptional regulator [Cohnella massiliensis]